MKRTSGEYPGPSKGAPRAVANVSTANSVEAPKTTLLATALVEAIAVDGTAHLLRVLCDQGSEASFCTEEVAQLLAYPRSRMHTEIIGIADEKPKTSNYSINVRLKPRFPSEYKLPVTLIILPKLTSSIPKMTVPQLQESYLENKIIADPTYFKRGPVDIILGAQEYSSLLLNGLQKFADGVIAQDTEFGWIFSGICRNYVSKEMKILSMTVRTEEIEQLSKFWELEEIPEGYKGSKEDQLCEEYYRETTVRSPDGTYTVRLPFKHTDVEYGGSRRKAAARLLQLEKKFSKDENLQRRYKEFMHEYLKLGHMRKVSKTEYCQGKYYFPHQPVINENSLTTKLRVVFDGSSKAGADNISLNENMLTGPRLQDDLTAILLRWRKHRIVFMADIEKMYRFIKVNEQDLTYQRILWRESPRDAIDEYELTTVTYGTASAPYLAVKTLQQLAIDEKERFPVASQVALRDFYVDDVLSGENTLEAAKRLQTELIKMLQKGGFNLRKWSSNSADLLESVPAENKDANMLKIPLDEARKSLGVLWSPLEDKFCFQITVNIKENPTKRVILSEIAKIFDPLGWLSPVVVSMKLIIQELWTNGAEWDKPVEGNIKEKWMEIQEQLKAIENIKIPRWCHITCETKIDIHGFSDASEKAYGAVVYVRVQVGNRYQVALLQAKSKVAPKKHKTTLPKLELCAAVVLAQLVERVIKAMELTKVDVYCWTDSMITLGWVKGEPERWKTFVSNRVAEIQRRVPQAKWNHVVSAQNPADVISRGVVPGKLQELTLWWNGPEWLQSENIPVTKTIPEICEEIKKSCHVVGINEPQDNWWGRFSSFQRMTRVLSYCLRLKRRRRGLLSCAEIERTAKQIIFLVQQEAFKNEYITVKAGKSMSKRNILSSLDPFVDKDGLLRVGGRLQKSDLGYNQKHPIILPHGHHVTSIIIHDAHLRTLHGGNNLTLSIIRQTYWIIGGKRLVKKCIRKCVKCIRYGASAGIQKMGTLPRARVTESFPFSHTGLDYAGPVQVRAWKGRGHKSYKGYIAVFVCLATKAIHLELVGDLTTESFIAALRRFTARRGPVSHIYSDNATNFVGAASILHREVLEICQSNDVQNTMTAMGTQWHFIPPSSPHFGGIWEAGVKSMKHHLRRVVGEQTLTYEELSTFLAQTEACLNTRPLCAQSTDINDSVILTPSHFLIGREAVGVPDPVSSFNTDLGNRWKQIQRMKRDFWKSWTRDYLHQLQQRYKWKSNQDSLEVGMVVLMKDENLSPSKWPLAKITEVHPGGDGLTRVVTLQKASGNTLKRSIHTLIPLPVKEAVEKDDKPATSSIVANVATRKKERRGGGTSGKFSCWAITLLVMIQLLSTTAAEYTLRGVQPGFYVEEVGTGSVDRGVFRIETSYDREHLEQGLQKIKGVTSEFKKLCDKARKATEETHCNQYYHHLAETASRFERTKEYLSVVNRTRSKRGLLGEMLTSVFGVNDEVYRNIDSLNKNQEQLIKAAKHQTKFMISAITQVNQTEGRMNQKLSKVQEKLNTVIEYMIQRDHWYTSLDSNNVNIQIIQAYQLASNYIEEIIEYYDGLLEIYLTKATVYSVLPPKNVSDLIEVANAKLPSNLRIVQQQLLDTRISENDTHIQVYAYFPIQDITKYTLMHITAVPKKNHDKSFQSIEIQKSYIGLNYNDELYFEMNHEEFKNCLQRFTHFICFPGAVKNMQSNDNCIVDQLFKNKTQTKCHTKTFDVADNIVLWQQLYMPNAWLFVVKDRTTASVICDGERKEVDLRDIGVLRISENCLVKTPNNILAAQRSISVQIVASYTKQVDFTMVAYNNPGRDVLNITQEEVVDSSNDILQHLVDQEQSLQTELDDTIWRQISKHTYLTAFGSSLASMLAIMLIYYYGPRAARKLRSKLRHRTGSPTAVDAERATTEATSTNQERPGPTKTPRNKGAREQPGSSTEPMYSHIYKEPQQFPDTHNVIGTQQGSETELYQLKSCS